MRKLIEKITGSDYFLIALLLVLGILNFGWVFFPVLGEINSIINAAAVFLVLLAVILRKLIKYKKPINKNQLLGDIYDKR